MDVLYLPSMYLGIVDDVEYEDLEVEIATGDALLLYSDGAIEEVNAEGVMFGDKRLQAAFREATSLHGGTHAALGIRRAVAQFAGSDERSAPIGDDMMLLLVEILPPST